MWYGIILLFLGFLGHAVICFSEWKAMLLGIVQLAYIWLTQYCSPCRNVLPSLLVQFHLHACNRKQDNGFGSFKPLQYRHKNLPSLAGARGGIKPQKVSQAITAPFPKRCSQTCVL